MNSAYILSEGNTATTDYFLVPYLQSQGYVTRLLDEVAGLAVPMQTRGALLVISRYLPQSWYQRLSTLKMSGMKIVYFMDDDLLDLSALSGLPWKYRWKIVNNAILRQRKIADLCDEFWVSTPHLERKYDKYQPRLIHAMPSKGLVDGGVNRVSFCYHATSSHRKEINWLANVVRKVQMRSENTHFEIFGGNDVRRHYRGIPRVSILHPMKWPDYLAWAGGMQRDIALAPLLSGAFNAGRGATKFYDYTRLGAVGIYTNVVPYKGFIEQGEDGILLDNDPDEWVETILMLASDEQKRKRLAASARTRAMGLGECGVGLVC